MKALPQASAIGAIHSGTMAGKLKGVIPATTPSGIRIECESTPPETCGVISPLSRWPRPQANSTTSSPRVTSPRASESTLPCSRVIRAAISSLWRSISARNANITWARLVSDAAPHSAAPADAAATARSTSAAVANGTRATTSPVAGSVTSPWRSAARSSRRPPIQCLRMVSLAVVLMPRIVAHRAMLAHVNTVLELETPHGPARAHLHLVDEPRAAVVLGHGAGGGVGARDLAKATAAANQAGASVALAEQPYLVAGRRSQAPAKQLDAAWTAVVEQLPFDGLPLITGGRSAGARVACRTAADTGSQGVLCLAFPLHPPGRPEKTRLSELDAVQVPVLIVQGVSDPFGMPPDGPGREIVKVPGNHSLTGDLAQLADAVEAWLARFTG